MAEIAGVPSQSVRQHPGQPGRLDGSQTFRALGQEFRNGTLVTGAVLSMGKNDSYLVQVQDSSGLSQKLLARATLPLFIGQNFRAVWDNSGEIPILRLSDDDFALLSKFGEGMERDIASALLARGMPVTSEMINLVRASWRLAGDKAETLSSVLELLARDLPMTPANIQIISWYLALERKRISNIWNRIRLAFKERVNKGESPMDALKSLLEGEEDVAMFLRGHLMLSKSLKHGIDKSVMASAAWVIGDDENPLLAKIWVSSDRSMKEKNREWWQIGFEMEGYAISTVSGEVESDTLSYVVGLRTDEENIFQLLRLKRDALRKELQDVPMSLQYIGVNRGKRILKTLNRTLDIKV